MTGLAFGRLALVVALALGSAAPVAADDGASARTSAPASAGQAGEVEAIRGAASAENGAGRRDLDRQAPVFRRDLVRTRPASRLTLALGRDTTLRLGAATEIRLVDYVIEAGGEIDLLGGAILYDSPGQGTAAPIRIDSSYGLIAVRGTAFFAGPSDGVFGVFVVRGEVEVTAGGSSVRLRPGFGTDIPTPGAPPGPPLAWSRARIDWALAGVN